MFSSTHEFHFRVRVKFEFYSFLDFKLEYVRVAKNRSDRVKFSSFELLDHALIYIISVLFVVLNAMFHLGVDVGSDCNSQFVHTKMIESIHATMSKRLKDFITDGTSPLCIIVDSSTGLLKKTNNCLVYI